MHSLYRILPWLPLVAVLCHLCEEFVWPGGFPAWYRWYHPEWTESISTRFLVRINALLVILALLAGLQGTGANGIALWLSLASVGAANAVFHLDALRKGARYSPGAVTGALLYLPLAVFGFTHFIANGVASPAVALSSALVGPAFNVWSAWNHQQRARVK